MRKLILSIALVFVFCTAALAQVFVSGYQRNNGTYVQPHYRSAPNQSTFDNYSSRGNTNPFTGEKGYRTPEYKPSAPFYNLPNKSYFNLK